MKAYNKKSFVEKYWYLGNGDPDQIISRMKETGVEVYIVGSLFIVRD